MNKSNPYVIVFKFALMLGYNFQKYKEKKHPILALYYVKVKIDRSGLMTHTPQSLLPWWSPYSFQVSPPPLNQKLAQLDLRAFDQMINHWKNELIFTYKTYSHLGAG